MTYSLDNSQERAFLKILQTRQPELDLAKPVAVIMPYYADMEKDYIPEDEIIAFNVDAMHELQDIEEHAKLLREKKFSYITTQIVFPDGSIPDPMMGPHSLGFDGKINSMNDFHKTLSAHAQHAGTVSTAEEFKEKWLTGTQLRAQQASLN